MGLNPKTRFIDRDTGRLAYEVIDGGTDGYAVAYQEPHRHLDLFWTDLVNAAQKRRFARKG